uniref:DUF1934 domain-containing protein n=1 Tax=Rhabditophanes sp. KR3021 TaxID=114890 RepID=A0AC35UDK8_9BILA
METLNMNFFPIKQVPDKFFGEFKSAEIEGLNAYLTAKGLPYLLRKIIGHFSFSKRYHKNTDGTYSFGTVIAKKEIKCDHVNLGEPIYIKGIGGTNLKITFSYDEIFEVLFESIEFPDDDTLQTEIHCYYFEKDKLILRTEVNDVTLKTVYKRIS